MTSKEPPRTINRTHFPLNGPHYGRDWARDVAPWQARGWAVVVGFVGEDGTAYIVEDEYWWRWALGQQPARAGTYFIAPEFARQLAR